MDSDGDGWKETSVRFIKLQSNVCIVLQLILPINFFYYVCFCFISSAGSAPAQTPYELHGYNDTAPPFTIPGRLAGEITFSQIAMRFVF